MDDTNRTKDGKISDLEEKCTNLAVEAERLRNVINAKNMDIEKSKTIITQLEIKLGDMKRLEAACQEKDGQIHLLLQNIEEWKQRNHQQEKYIEELKKYQDLCKDYEFKMGQLTNEIERLNSVIKNYIQENESQRNRIADLEL